MAGRKARLTLVLTGGGARAAYQVGFLRSLARRFPELHVPVYTGVSAGAINAAYLANHGGSFAEAVEDLSRLWYELSIDQVFRVDTRSLLGNALGWGWSLISGRHEHPSAVKGLVDTSPLRLLLQDRLTPEEGLLAGLRDNIRRGRVRALAVTGTNYATGQSVTWVQGEEIATWDRPHRRSARTDISVDHILASCALPLFFPAVRVGDSWYGDGGIRQAAPLSPALHLGAEQILAISTRYLKSMEEAEVPAIPGYPPPAQIISTLMSAVFLDVLDRDARQLEKVNALLDRIPGPTPAGVRQVSLFVLRPSRDLGRLAGKFEADLPKMFRFLGRRLGTNRTSSPDWLSMLLFDPGYIRAMIEVGEADAEGQLARVETLLC